MFDKPKGSKQPTPEPVETKAPAPAPAPAASPGPAAVSSPQKVALIGGGITISGDVKADSNLRVEGTIEGRGVQSSNDIEVAESGRVVANIEARVVRIGGEVTGDISGSEKVMILKSGRVLGNVVAPRVLLEDGAHFRGSIDMDPTPVANVKPAADKPVGADLAARTPAATAVPRPDSAAGARKEPGLTLKSG